MDDPARARPRLRRVTPRPTTLTLQRQKPLGPVLMKLRKNLLIALAGAWLAAPASALSEVRAADITHAFLATGGATYIRDGQGKVTWQYSQPSRDGWVLPDGHVLLALGKSQGYPGGGVVEVTEGGEVVLDYKG